MAGTQHTITSRSATAKFATSRFHTERMFRLRATTKITTIFPITPMAKTRAYANTKIIVHPALCRSSWLENESLCVNISIASALSFPEKYSVQVLKFRYMVNITDATSNVMVTDKSSDKNHLYFGKTVSGQRNVDGASVKF